MDSLSYRKNRPANGSDESQAHAETAVPLEFDAPTSSAPRARRESAHSRYGSSKKSSGSKLPWIISAVLGVVVLGYLILSLFGLVGSSGAAPMVDNSKYQAVFLSNGQVYFGKLGQAGAEYMKLTEVFYLQKKTAAADEANPQDAAAQSTEDVELVKLGNEIHGPEDTMLIAKEQVLFYENLKSDSTVAKTISEYQSQKK